MDPKNENNNDKKHNDKSPKRYPSRNRVAISEEDSIKKMNKTLENSR